MAWYYSAWWTRQGNVSSIPWQVGSAVGPTLSLDQGVYHYQHAVESAPSRSKTESTIGYVPFQSYAVLYYWKEDQPGWKIWASKGPIDCNQF